MDKLSVIHATTSELNHPSSVVNKGDSIGGHLVKHWGTRPK